MKWIGRRKRNDSSADITEELEAHLTSRTEDLMEQGVPEHEARNRARREFGNVMATLEQAREVWQWVWWDRFTQDIGYAIRTMRKSPVFTATAIVCLALGIGANTAIFSVIHKVLLEPLPYPDADRIVIVGRVGPRSTASPKRYASWLRSDHGLEALTAFQGGTANLNGGDSPEAVRTIATSHNYFQLFGANPILGRTFGDADDRPGVNRIVLLSHGLWQRDFGGDPAVLGKTISLGDEAYLVVGVLSPQFTSYPPADIWIPLQIDPESSNEASILTVAGRLPHNTTLANANARMRVIQAAFARTDRSLDRGTEVQVAYLREQIAGEVRPLLLTLLGAVALVLLIACANVANLLLARATSREKEIAIRAAIGAGRGRLVRQLVTESLLLASAGAALGLLVGRVALSGLLAIMPGELPRASEIAAISTLNPWVAGFAALLALFTGVLFGLLPAIRMSQTPLTLSLKEGSGGSGIGSKGRRSLEVLVISEIATSLVLLSAALLMIRSFAAMHKQDLGFDSRALLTMEISLTGTHYQDSNRVDRFGREVISRLQNIPGVESAAMASALPLFGHIDMIFDIPGRSHPQGRKIMGDVQWRFVTPDYFRVLRIPLIAGRSLTNQESIKVVVISQSMARQFWPDTNPVGKTLLIGAGLGDPAFITGPTEIVGVVGDVRGRLDQAHGEPVMYLLPSQIPDRAMALMRRIDDAAILVRPQQGFSALALSQPVQNALRAVDRLPITKVQTMEQAVWNSTPQRTFNLFLFGSFAALAIGLAAVGIYGVTAYSVEQKRSEIGIRGALGATRGDIFRWVQRQALTMTVAGIVLGMAASLGLTRFIRSLLFGVTPFDTLTFVAVPIIALAVGVAAAVIPALRASRVDPVVALRIG